MGGIVALPAQGGRTGGAKAGEPARNPQCDILPVAHRLSVAHAAARSAALGNSVLLFQPLAG